MKNFLHILIIICIILLFIFISLYFLKFNNFSDNSQRLGIEDIFAMFSDNQGDWGNFGDYIGGLLAFFTVIILFYIHFNEKDFRQAETFDNLVKEYSSKEFHKELKNLDKFRGILIDKYHLKKDISNILYIKISHKEIIKYKEFVIKNTFQNYNDSRRIVSNFFQRMSILLKKSYLKKDLVLAFWGEDHSLLLENLIIPFERSLLENLKDIEKGLDEKDIEKRLECLNYIKDELNVKVKKNKVKEEEK